MYTGPAPDLTTQQRYQTMSITKRGEYKVLSDNEDQEDDYNEDDSDEVMYPCDDN